MAPRLPTVLVLSLGIVGLVGVQGGAIGKKHKENGKVSSAKPVVGRFSGAPTSYIGRLILEIAEDGSYSFLNLVTMHLPPVELENRHGQVTFSGDKGCLLPAPEAIEPCFTAQGPDMLQVVQKRDGKQVTLRRIVDQAK
jgi:hypothetical protein